MQDYRIVVVPCNIWYINVYSVNSEFILNFYDFRQTFGSIISSEMSTEKSLKGSLSQSRDGLKPILIFENNIQNMIPAEAVYIIKCL